VGMNSIVITESDTPSLEKIYNEIMDYTDFYEPIMMRFANEFTIKQKLEKENEVESSEKSKEDKELPNNKKQIEEVKMLSEVHGSLVDLDKCSLHELINILQKKSNDPSINVLQAGLGSYIENYVIKEKIARYNNKAMIPPKLEMLCSPRY
jgi:hypothetical protein